MLNCTGAANDWPLGPSSMAVPATSRGEAVGFAAGSTVIWTFDQTAPGGTVRVTAPPSAVTAPPFTPITAPSFTVTSAEADCPPAVAVMVAVPTETPVTMPAVETEAWDWSELVQATLEERLFPPTSFTVALRDSVAVGTSVAALVDSVTDPTSGAVGESLPPQPSVKAAAAARESVPSVTRRFMIDSS